MNGLVRKALYNSNGVLYRILTVRSDKEGRKEKEKRMNRVDRWMIWMRNTLYPDQQTWIPLSNLEEEEGDKEVDFTAEADDLKKKRLNILFLLLSLVCFFTGSIFYHDSLRGGDIVWIHQNLSSLATSMVLAVCCFYAGFFMLLYRRKDFHPVLWYPLVIGIVAVLWFAVVGKELGATEAKHGLYNLAMFVVLNIVLLIYTLIWKISIRRLGVKKAIIVHLLLTISILAAVAIHNKELKRNWRKGLPGKELNNTGVGCDIPTDFVPYAAYLPEGWSSVIGQKCPSTKHFATLEENILTITCTADNVHYTEQPNYLTARTDYNKDLTDMVRYYGEVEVQRVFNYTGPVETHAEIIEAVCGDNKQVFMRNVQREEVIDRANKTTYPSEQFDLPHPPNILFIFIDALSRAHAHRRLTSTMKTLATLDESDEFSVYEFFKYHALETHTGPNTVPMYAGRVEDWTYPGNATYQVPQDKLPDYLWWKQFDDQYVKAWEYGNCEDWPKTYMNSTQLPYSMDHTLIMPFCNPQNYPLQDPLGPLNGPYGMRARCIGDKHVHSYLLDYTREYFGNYQNFGKLAHLNFMEAHEGSLEVIGQMDDDLSDFLLSPEIQNELDNTFVFLVADHGNHMSPFFLWTKGGKVENRLPMLFLIAPRWFNERYPTMSENLRTNQQRLVSSFDVYYTLMELRNLPEFAQHADNEERHDLSGGLFRAIPEDRTCDEAFVRPDLCICNN